MRSIFFAIPLIALPAVASAVIVDQNEFSSADVFADFIDQPADPANALNIDNANNLLSEEDTFIWALTGNGGEPGFTITFGFTATETLDAINTSVTNVPGSFGDVEMFWAANPNGTGAIPGTTTFGDDAAPGGGDLFLESEVSLAAGQQAWLTVIYDGIFGGNDQRLNFRVESTADDEPPFEGVIPVPPAIFLLAGGLGALGLFDLRRRRNAA